MSLQGKVAVITGGSTGIGLGIARVLAKKGVKLVLAQIPALLDDADRVVAAEFARASAFAIATDITDYEAVQRMVAEAVERFGRLDILVNNAGVTGTPAVVPFLDCSPAKFDQIVDVNLKGAFFCSQAAARQMIDQGHGGSVVHISSVGAFAAQEDASVYCATKSALTSLAQSMAIELAPYRIRVNCVAPGDIDTPSSAPMVRMKQQNLKARPYVRTTPLGRRGQPEDVGHAVAYLVSDEAEFVTGTTLLVDGGFLAY